MSFLFIDIELDVEKEDTLLLDVHGEIIKILRTKRRIGRDEIPLTMKEAFIAIEDERFYRHIGLDPIGLLRAAITNLKERRIVQGGSTITQQLAKNAFLTHERTFYRKLQEMILALRLEHRYSKDEILYHYLNHIYLGHGVYGVREASLFYFSREVEELSLAEIALLAGITRAPELYSPLVHPNEALFRRNLVLDKMEDLQLIKSSEAEEARRRSLDLSIHRDEDLVAPYFQDYILEDLELIIGEEEIPPGHTIYTTLQLEIQREVEEIASSFLWSLSSYQEPPQLAILVLDPQTGEIKAMVGGRDYQESAFNRVTRAKRQSGSAFKPITFAAALEEGLTPISTFMSQPTTFSTGDTTYQPENFNQEYFYREITLREALCYSDNVVAVKIQEEITPEKTLDLAYSLGFTTPLPGSLSLVLGTGEVTPLEIAQSYSSLANGGYQVQIHGIREVRDGEKILFKQGDSKRRVLREGTSSIITSILEDVIREGTARGIRGTAPPYSAGKTGTSQENRDAWFIGYTPSLLTCIWIGYDYPKDLEATGGSLAAPLWAKIMGSIAPDEKGWKSAESILKREICKETVLLSTESCPETIEEYFLPGTAPSMRCNKHPQSERSTPWSLRDDFFPQEEDVEEDPWREEDGEDGEDEKDEGEREENEDREEREEDEKDWGLWKEEIKEKIQSFLQKTTP